MTDKTHLKRQVQTYWSRKSCGEVYARGVHLRERFDKQAETRYALEPYILDFAKFTEGEGKDVLEVGVGMGADHLEWAKVRPKSLTGIDLTTRAVEFTRARLSLSGFSSNLVVGDAENLPFEDGKFDVVYSWGVLHHSPDTRRAVREVYRVLRPSGVARVMIYHRKSLVGYMLWVRYALFNHNLKRSMNEIYANYLESPGTKAFSIEEARNLFRQFSQASVRTQLTFADFLEGAVGGRHQSVLLRAAKLVWPRWLVKRLFASRGLALVIEATK